MTKILGGLIIAPVGGPFLSSEYVKRFPDFMGIASPGEILWTDAMLPLDSQRRI